MPLDTYTLDGIPNDILTSDRVGERRLKVESGDDQAAQGLSYDAWGRQKAVTDYSLFQGIYTFEVPEDLWIAKNNDVEVFDFTAEVRSRGGRLVVKSGANEGDVTSLHSRRHPRYQANRGHLYSNSLFLPSPLRQATRDFGMFTSEAGAFFRLDSDGELHAVTRTKESDSLFLTEDGNDLIQESGFYLVTTDGSVLERSSHIPNTTGIDYEKGNTYDIQMQWRGVGDIAFFINQQLSVKFSNLGNLSDISISNPALPASFVCTNEGEDAKIICGCVDITSEGGTKPRGEHRMVSVDDIAIANVETPYLVLSVEDFYLGELNTRDCIMESLEAYSDGNSTMVRLYRTRDKTAFTTTNSTDTNRGFQKVSYNGEIENIDYDKLKKLYQRRVPQNSTKYIFEENNVSTDFFISHGDYILITMESTGDTTGGFTLIYNEEV